MKNLHICIGIIIFITSFIFKDTRSQAITLSTESYQFNNTEFDWVLNFESPGGGGSNNALQSNSIWGSQISASLSLSDILTVRAYSRHIESQGSPWPFPHQLGIPLSRPEHIIWSGPIATLANPFTMVNGMAGIDEYNVEWLGADMINGRFVEGQLQFTGQHGTGQGIPQAGILFEATVRGVTGGNAYDGQWIFQVDLDLDMDKITLTVKDSNSSVGDDFKHYMYMYDVIEDPNVAGKYNFGPQFDQGNPPDTDGLTLSGMYIPSSKKLMIDSPVESGGLTFDISNVKLVPEPTTNLSLIAVGTLGAASILKRKLKPSQPTEKETTKVG